jgi:hypothetical protein
MTTTWITKQEACALLKVSGRTLARYRDETLMDGIHFSRISVQKILYNKELLLDWIPNRHDWATHLRAIEIYRASLPSNQKRRKAS